MRWQVQSIYKNTFTVKLAGHIYVSMRLIPTVYNNKDTLHRNNGLQ